MTPTLNELIEDGLVEENVRADQEGVPVTTSTESRSRKRKNRNADRATVSSRSSRSTDRGSKSKTHPSDYLYCEFDMEQLIHLDPCSSVSRLLPMVVFLASRKIARKEAFNVTMAQSVYRATISEVMRNTNEKRYCIGFVGNVNQNHWVSVIVVVCGKENTFFWDPMASNTQSVSRYAMQVLQSEAGSLYPVVHKLQFDNCNCGPLVVEALPLCLAQVEVLLSQDEQPSPPQILATLQSVLGGLDPASACRKKQEPELLRVIRNIASDQVLLVGATAPC